MGEHRGGPPGPRQGGPQGGRGGPPQGGRGGPRPYGDRSGPPRGPSRGPARGPSRGPARGPGGPRREGGRSGPPRQSRWPEEVPALYKDWSIVAVDKPAGLAVLGAGSKSTRSVVRLVGRAMNAKAMPMAANELDRDASGALILAASPHMASLFERALHRGSRHWVALVIGTPPAESGTLVSRLHRGPRGVTEPVPEGTAADEDAWRAICHYRTLGSGNGLSVVRVRAETDVPGQIRAQLHEAGMTVVGDKSFSAERDDIGRLGLHLSELVCEDPRESRGSARTLRFTSPTPAEFWTAAELEAPKHARSPEPVRPEAAPPPPPSAEDSPEAQDRPTAPAAPAEKGWDHVAAWYDELIDRRRSDHHDEVIHPGAARLLGAEPGVRILDVACGQGELARVLAQKGADVVGVDASPALIEMARERSPERLEFAIADARTLEGIEPASFDGAACVLALMNIDPIEPMLARLNEVLRPGGRAVFVVMHPAFRVPKASGWAWGEHEGQTVQRRLIERYLTPSAAPIVMNPGGASKGERTITTTSHHRPIGAIVAAIAGAGLVVDAMEEWASSRVSEPGPRADAENTARAEIPMFLAIRAIKPAANAG